MTVGPVRAAAFDLGHGPRPLRLEDPRGPGDLAKAVLQLPVREGPDVHRPQLLEARSQRAHDQPIEHRFE